jgi:hypothetical protein
MPQTCNQTSAKKAKTIQDTKKRSSPRSNRRSASKKSSSPRSNCSSNRATGKGKDVVKSEENQRQNTKRPHYNEESHTDDNTNESYDASNSS